MRRRVGAVLSSGLWPALFLGLGLAGRPASLTAQLPGVTPPAPPGHPRAFELRFANDFLGRGGAIDDFRTQQLGLVARLAPAWTLVFDYSILTGSEPNVEEPARVDHITISGGRRLLGTATGSHLEVGAGLRYSGSAAGSRVQNGFHQLVGSTLETMPYVGTDRVDGVFWAAAPLHGTFRRSDGTSVLGGRWALGYQVRSATLISTDGEWDGSVAGLATVSRGLFQGWVGLRGDWRAGHDRDRVTAVTADFEEGVAGVLGIRVGPLVLETAQGFDGESAYGHLSLLSDGGPRSDAPGDEEAGSRGPVGPESGSGLGLEAGFTLPDVTARVLGRWWPTAGGSPSGWRPSVVVEGRFGAPQFGLDVERYVDTWQLSGALEVERAPLDDLRWLTLYGAAGAGWRQERLEGFGGPVEGLRSESVGGLGLTGELGGRVATEARGERVGLALQLGISGWLPASSRAVSFDGDAERLLGASLALTTGLIVRVRTGQSR